jgi:hypothetical protein
MVILEQRHFWGLAAFEKSGNLSHSNFTAHQYALTWNAHLCQKNFGIVR